MSWDLKFYEPIPLPGQRKPLATLRDAVQYMTSLPRAEQNAEHWRPAATLLGIIGENGGCVVFARIAVMYGLRKRVQAEPPEPDPSKKTTHWGRRKLKRDR
ncbi:MAG: hypothetical protein QOI07_3606 [Verrucomicrobiota bacterium]